MQQPLYTSAPILDYDDEPQTPLTDEEMLDSAGVMTLESEQFDAAILEALVSP
ncbi:MAG: hypothetical protein ACJ762_16415 [Solirubrobacteraceae bacterium]